MKSFLGNKDIVNRLKKRRKEGKWPQALLLTGPEGVGKAQLLKNLALQILCEDSKGCGSCRSCGQVLSGGHPDLFLLEAPKGKVLIPIDLVRKMSQWESVASVVRRGKVIIVSPADSLTEEAQNSLLKVLEEPNSESQFLMQCQDDSALLPTIVTRCFQLRLNSLSLHELKTIAKENAWPVPTDMDLQLAQGSAKTLQLLLQCKFSDFTEHFLLNLSQAAGAIGLVQLSQGMFRFFEGLDKDQEILEHFKEENFVAWILSLFRLMLEDSTRMAEGMETVCFRGAQLKYLKRIMQRTSKDHRYDLARELDLLENDLSLNLPPISVLEEALSHFFEKRYIQQNDN